MCRIQQAQQAAPVTGAPVVLFLLNDIYQKIFARKFPYPSSLTHFYMKFIFFEQFNRAIIRQTTYAFDVLDKEDYHG